MSQDQERLDLEHIGPGTLAGRYFRRFWHPVLRAEELAPGGAKPVRLLGEDYTLYRGHSGTPYLVAFRCAHRGTQLSTGWVEEECIRCLYHGWKYEGSGQCVEQPAEEAGFASKVRIGGYPVREQVGLIFAYVGEGTAPEFPYPAFNGEGIVETWADPFPCNYLSNVENSTDYLHANWAHRTSAGTSFHVASGTQAAASFVPLQAHETEFGLERRRQVGATQFWNTLILPDGLMTLPGIPGPSRMLQEGVGGGLRPTYLFKIPIDDYNHVLYWSQLVQVTGAEAEAYREKYQRYLDLIARSRPVVEVARDILAGKMPLAAAREHPQFLILEDLVSQVGQGPIVERSSERLGRSDNILIILRKILEREVRALGEGRPLKQWQVRHQWPQTSVAAVT